MDTVFVGRQPIYDRDLKVYAYELLYRDADRDHAVFSDGDEATSDILTNTFMHIGLEQLVGSRPAFLNFGRRFLTGAQAVPMAPEQVVIEVVEQVEADAEVVRGIERLVAGGYSVALDDFTFDEHPHPLLPLARMVKLEVNGVDEAFLAEQVRRGRELGLELLAEKVETQEEYARCRALGFDYFQGFFFSRPQVLRGRKLPTNRLVTLQLIARLQDPEVDARELEQIVVQDVSLSFALLRYINCASYAIRHEIESVRHAILLLGTEAIRNWATLLALRDSGSDKPQELMVTALVRAKMCEQLTRVLGHASPHQAFTVGLLSILDAVMDAPMAELLDAVPLNSDIKLALLDFEGPHGATLRQVLDYEHARWDALHADAVEDATFTSSYLQALTWAREHGPALVA